MRSVLKLLLPVAVALGVMMFGTAGGAAAACSADSSSGRNSSTKTGTHIPVPVLGQGWVGAGPGGVTGSAERAGTGYIEGVVSVSGTNVNAAGEAANDNPTVGYFDGQAGVSGTTVTASGDGSTLNGTVGGSAEVNSANAMPADDVQVNNVACATP